MREKGVGGRVLFFAHSCYLDDSNGATIASRATLEALSRRGFAVEALTGTVLESTGVSRPESGLFDKSVRSDVISGTAISLDSRGMRVGGDSHVRDTLAGVSFTLHHCPSSKPHEPDGLERAEVIALLGQTLDRFRPDVLLTFGGDLMAHEARSLARERGAAVVFALHNFNYTDAATFATTDAVIVPSRFAADHYRKSLNLDCVVLPNLVDVDRAKVRNRDPRYLTFVNPTEVKGVYPFARIADELGRRRPDIPILVVESRGDERSLVDCGIDLRGHGKGLERS